MGFDTSHGDTSAEWCGRCLTSSGVRWDLYVLTEQPAVVRVGTVQGCVRCDPWLSGEMVPDA